MELALSVIGPLARSSQPSKTARRLGWIQEDELALSHPPCLELSLNVFASLRLPEQISHLSAQSSTIIDLSGPEFPDPAQRKVSLIRI
jgi:hypothetical protein